jgi:hypothetical protein
VVAIGVLEALLRPAVAERGTCAWAAEILSIFDRKALICVPEHGTRTRTRHYPLTPLYTPKRKILCRFIRQADEYTRMAHDPAEWTGTHKLGELAGGTYTARAALLG